MKEYIIKVGDEPDIMGNYPLTEKAKELVRCKDCKKRNTAECIISSMNGDACFPWNTPDDWFCADGERKDGDGNG